MATHEVIRVEIELASDLEPISGQVRMPDARARSFTGVLELINLLDEARAQPMQTVGTVSARWRDDGVGQDGNWTASRADRPERAGS